MNHLTDTLQSLFNNNRGKGGFTQSWSSLQCEMVLEELFYGRLLYHLPVLYSISLGTNSTDPNSLTKQRGFLGLSPVGSTSVGESPPPLKIWINDPIQRQRIERLFPLTNALQASPAVVGENLLKVLLSDLHDRNDRLNIQALKQQTPPLLAKLIGCRTKQQFCRELSERKAFNHPLAFGRAVELAQSAGHDVSRCLIQEMQEYKYFPCITYWDEKRHPKAKWNKRDYIQLLNDGETPSPVADAAAVIGDV